MENLEERQRIGDTIRKARKANKITQKNLSNALNIRQDVVSDYENGKIKVIPFDKRVKLARILEIPLANLLYEEESLDTLINSQNALMSVYSTSTMEEIGLHDAIKSIRDKESSIFAKYFIEKSSEWNLGQLIYAVIKAFSILRSHNTFYNVLEYLLFYRFTLTGMHEKVACQYANQLLQPLVYMYHGYIFENAHLEDWFSDSNVSDKTFQAALADVLVYFQKIRHDENTPDTKK